MVAAAETAPAPSGPGPTVPGSSSDESLAKPNGGTRVLIVGQARFDMTMDSYRRTLAPHYEVEVIDPFAILGAAGQRWLSPQLGAQVNRVVTTLSRMLSTGEVALAESRIARIAAEFQPDLLLTDCVEVLRPRFIDQLRKACPHARFLGRFNDAISNLGRGYAFTADYDRVFFKDHHIVDKLRSKLRSKNAFYLPQAFDRMLHRRVELSESDRRRFGCDIAVYGNGYLYRAETMKLLLGRDVKIWGGGLPRWAEHVTASMFTGRYVAGEEKCRAMLAAKVALNANHYSEIAGTNKRTFELAGMGAFQLTDTPALSDVFVPDHEVAWYESADDLLEKLDHYLARPELRRDMAERARAKALSAHTYEHRWTAMLESVGLRPPAAFPVQPEDLVIRAT